MDKEKLRELLEQVKTGNVDIDSAMNELKRLPYDNIGYARIDNHRSLRNGYPEVIYCEGKFIEHICGIVERILSNSSANIIATRASSEVFDEVKKVAPTAVYHDKARIISVVQSEKKKNSKKIVVVTGGTSDIKVAEEAAVTAELLGNNVERVYDVGVAGIHRLFDSLELIQSANVIIAVAGMEGALASVVGGLVDKPVIAVPTSVGYGASFGGLAALLSMLNSCASGVSVVNIDNGFGAGYMASMINALGN